MSSHQCSVLILWEQLYTDVWQMQELRQAPSPSHHHHLLLLRRRCRQLDAVLLRRRRRRRRTFVVDHVSDSRQRPLVRRFFGRFRFCPNILLRRPGNVRKILRLVEKFHLRFRFSNEIWECRTFWSNIFIIDLWTPVGAAACAHGKFKRGRKDLSDCPKNFIPTS